MKIDVEVIYERELRWSKWDWLNNVLKGWYLAAGVAGIVLCLPAVLLMFVMTGRSSGTLLKRIGRFYETVIG